MAGYSISPEFNELLLALYRGPVDEASNELNIFRNTAKSLLSAVFSKTGVTWQTKLIQLILKSVGLMGE